MRSVFFLLLSTHLFCHQLQQDWSSSIDFHSTILKSVCNGDFSALEIGCNEGCYLGKKYPSLCHITVDENQHLLQKLIETHEFKNNFFRSKRQFFPPRRQFFRPKHQLIYNFALDSGFLNAKIKSLAPKKTFKELLFRAYQDGSKNQIKLIKTDLQGGEEFIIEDVFDTINTNSGAALIKLYPDQWQEINKEEILSYFQFFDFYHQGAKIEDLKRFLDEETNPIVCILPKKNNNFLKKNPTVLIIAYNLSTFVQKMVDQVQKYTKDIVILDNASFFPPLLNYYETSYPYTLFRMDRNYGHTIYKEKFLENIVAPRHFITDPDLCFNPCLPENFMQDLIAIQDNFKHYRVGLALDIFSDDINENLFIGNGISVKEWEGPHWVKKMVMESRPDFELYQAAIDTTFCLIDRRFNLERFDLGIRVAGKYTCKHIPWHKDFELQLQPGEMQAYLERNRSSNWILK
jgi:hypothetical protein